MEVEFNNQTYSFEEIPNDYLDFLVDLGKYIPLYLLEKGSIYYIDKENRKIKIESNKFDEVLS